MSTHKHIDVICVVVTAVTLLLTVLFMNGERLGIKPVVTEESSSDMFSAADLDGNWDTDGAEFITLDDENTAVKGNGAYYADGVLHIVYAGKYVLSGTLTDGSVEINADGDDKVYILLDNAEIKNETGAALLIEQADKVILTLADGSENVLSCGDRFSDDAVASGADGAVYSRDDLTVNGSGALTVTAGYKHGIVCNDDLKFTGGTIRITAAEDAVHANDSVRIQNASLELTAGDDGITASNDKNTSFIYVGSGKIDVLSCYEGLEACRITVDGGDISVYPTDDGLNANGGERVIEINGGDISVINTTGRDADGFDSNGDIFINGGNIFISVPNDGSSSALDYGSENGGKCVINGGTVAAFGGSNMAEAIEESSGQGFIMKQVTNCPKDSSVLLTDGDKNELINVSVPSSFSLVILSCPGMEVGDTLILSLNGETQEINVDNSSEGGMNFNSGSGMRDPGGRPGDFNGEPPQDRSDIGDRGSEFSPENENGQPPEIPDGEMPSMPDREPPQKPDGEMPSMPDGEPPQRPDGDFSFDPNGQTPNASA